MHLSLNSLKNKYENHKTTKATEEELGHIKLSDLPTKESLEIDKVQNYNISTQEDAEVGTSNESYMTPLRVKQAISAQAIEKKPLTWNDLKG